MKKKIMRKKRREKRKKKVFAIGVNVCFVLFFCFFYIVVVPSLLGPVSTKGLRGAVAAMRVYG
jgi:uncharacterized protein YqhQ